MKSFLDLIRKWKTGFQGLSRAKQILYAGTLAVVLGSLALLTYTVNRVEFTPLYSQLNEQDLGGVVETLKNKKIPYQLNGAGGVSIPREQLHEVRLLLATQGVVKGSGVGFEIFDQQKLGSTEFVQRINYQRALQGELARTINEMNEVQESRVHLVLPSESLFVEDRKPPSAAVVLKLKSGARLESQQVQGIVNLVAGAVQGLTEDKVSILSTDGQVLFRKNAVDNTLQLSTLQMQVRSKIEDDLRQKVQSLLEQVTGANKVTTRVTVDMDFNQMQVTEDIYDPDSQVIRSQQRSTENNQGAELGAKGNPDVPINVEAQLMQSSPPGKDKDKDKESPNSKASTRQRETVNYEINRVNRQTTHAPGNVKKISVAVLVDGPYEMKPNAEGKTEPVFVGRSPEQIKSLEDIVRKAIGYNEGRGDQITVSNIPFATESAEADGFVKAENRWIKLAREYIKPVLNVLIVLLVFFLIVRPLMRRFATLSEEMKHLPAPGEALPAGDQQTLSLPDQPVERELSLRRRALSLVQQNPDQAAAIIRAILREEQQA
jgi:flagellar M-ring protein FliF